MSISPILSIQNPRTLSDSSFKIKNSEGNVFSVFAASSKEELSDFPIDSRITFTDTPTRLSCFKGIGLDPEYTRSQIFVIKDDKLTVGVITLFCIPYKNFEKKGYLKLENNELFFTSCKKLLNISNQNSFIIETGWFYILPEHRNKKLGSNILANFIIPYMKNLVQGSSADIVIMCSTKGIANDNLRGKISKIWETRCQEKITISQEDYDKLGKADPNSIFTSESAQKMGLLLEEGLFNFCFGPVFVKKFSPQEYNT